MNTDALSLRADVTVEVVLRYLRMRGELPEKTDRLFVVDRLDVYLGTVPLTRLLTSDLELPVSELLESEAPRIDPEMPAHDVSQLFQERDLISAAVVSKEGRLLGRITIDDVVDVIREEAEHSVLSMAGLRDEEDVFAGVFVSTKRRLFWLGINLLTAILAGLVVREFEGTIEKVAALAALDADRREHGRHRGHADRDSDHPRPGAWGRFSGATRGGCCSRRSRSAA